MSEPERTALRLIKLSGAAMLLLVVAMFIAMPKQPVHSNVDGLSGTVVAFELAATPEHVFAILGEPGHPARSAVVESMDLTNWIDFLFMLAYPTMCASIAALLVARGLAPRALAWIAGGLALAMCAGDFIENRQLLALSQLTDPTAMAEPLARLRAATTVKWAALFLSAVLVAWPVWRDASAWHWSAPLFALAGLVGFAGALWRPAIEHGANVLAAAWIWTWIHALRR